MEEHKRTEQEEFEENLEPVVEEDAAEILSKHQTALGLKLVALFSQAETDRRSMEDVWMRNLRQFKGIYDPEVLAQMDPVRSKAFLSITRTKVKAVTSRMVDILFPTAGEQCWDLKPSPLPDLNPKLEMDILNQITEVQGEPPTLTELQNILYNEAQERARKMKTTIKDQLNHGKFREIIKKVLHSGALYGSGVLKGPTVRVNTSQRWVTTPEGDWATINIQSYVPVCESVSLWDVYPDMSVVNVEDGDFIFQRHVLPKHKLLELGKRPGGFKDDVIQAYLSMYPQGSRSSKNYEVELADLSMGESGGTTNTINYTDKYEIVEYWGYLHASELADVGVEIDQDMLGQIVAANVWILDGYVIKAIISPLEGVKFPYHFYYYEKDETSIYGLGLPEMMKDSQRLFNASVRAMLDNAAFSAGPFMEVNTDLLAPDEDPTKLHPFRVFQRHGTGVEATAKAINLYHIPTQTTHFMRMVEFFLGSADEITSIPRYMYGESSQLGAVGRTSSGLSMLMGAANINIKDQIKNFDDGIIEPFIKAMYFWNMDYNPREDIKGDFNAEARGTVAMMAKEVLTEKMMQWLQITNNEVDLQYTNREVALRETAEVMELGVRDIVKSPEQIALEREQLQRAQEEQQAYMMELERLKAVSSGHVGNEGQALNQPQQPEYQEVRQAQGYQDV